MPATMIKTGITGKAAPKTIQIDINPADTEATIHAREVEHADYGGCVFFKPNVSHKLFFENVEVFGVKEVMLKGGGGEPLPVQCQEKESEEKEGFKTRYETAYSLDGNFTKGDPKIVVP